MVSPKRQYLGIFEPTTPATILPVWIPALICIVLGFVSGLTIKWQEASKSKAMLQISVVCLGKQYG